jgi:hypothetical protein
MLPPKQNLAQCLAMDAWPRRKYGSALGWFVATFSFLVLVPDFSLHENPSYLPSRQVFHQRGGSVHVRLPIALRGGQRSRAASIADELENDSDDGADDEVLFGKNEEAEDHIVDAEHVIPQLKGLGIDLKMNKNTPPANIASQIYGKVKYRRLD